MTPLTDTGLRNSDLQIYQTFIAALNKVIARQVQQVAICERNVSHAVANWRKEKRQFDAFMVLQRRAIAEKSLAESRREQKSMDEFAQRTANGRGKHGH